MLPSIWRGRDQATLLYDSVEKHVLPFLQGLRIAALLIWGGADATVPVAPGLALSE